MRTYEEYEEILKLWELGISKKRISVVMQIPRRTVIDCIQRYGSMKGLEENRERASRSKPDEVLARIRDPQNVQVQQAYAYLLGIYLGDGSIVVNRKVYRLRVTLDKKYPNIINTCMQAIQTVLPENKVGLVAREGCYDVSCHHKFWPDLFPQHGEGAKHLRQIKLEEWQLQIVDKYPLEFFRGLFHSDGSRDRNVVKGREYPRYAFTNLSQDIRQLYCYTCNLLGLHWTVATNGRNINIARRADVEYLDRVVGPKS